MDQEQYHATTKSANSLEEEANDASLANTRSNSSSSVTDLDTSSFTNNISSTLLDHREIQSRAASVPSKASHKSAFPTISEANTLDLNSDKTHNKSPKHSFRNSTGQVNSTGSNTMTRPNNKQTSSPTSNRAFRQPTPFITRRMSGSANLPPPVVLRQVPFSNPFASDDNSEAHGSDTPVSPSSPPNPGNGRFNKGKTPTSSVPVNTGQQQSPFSASTPSHLSGIRHASTIPLLSDPNTHKSSYSSFSNDAIDESPTHDSQAGYEYPGNSVGRSHTMADLFRRKSFSSGRSHSRDSRSTNSSHIILGSEPGSRRSSNSSSLLDVCLPIDSLQGDASQSGRGIFDVSYMDEFAQNERKEWELLQASIIQENNEESQNEILHNGISPMVHTVNEVELDNGGRFKPYRVVPSWATTSTQKASATTATVGGVTTGANVINASKDGPRSRHSKSKPYDPFFIGLPNSNRRIEGPPLRFTYFREDLEATVHSPTIAGLLQEGQTFDDLFNLAPQINVNGSANGGNGTPGVQTLQSGVATGTQTPEPFNTNNGAPLASQLTNTSAHLQNHSAAASSAFPSQSNVFPPNNTPPSNTALTRNQQYPASQRNRVSSPLSSGKLSHSPTLNYGIASGTTTPIPPGVQTENNIDGIIGAMGPGQPTTAHHASSMASSNSQTQQANQQGYDGTTTPGVVYEPSPFWLDVMDPTEEEMKVLSKSFGIHPLTTEDIFLNEPREKVELFKNYYLVCFRSFDIHDERSKQKKSTRIIEDRHSKKRERRSKYRNHQRQRSNSIRSRNQGYTRYDGGKHRQSSIITTSNRKKKSDSRYNKRHMSKSRDSELTPLNMYIIVFREGVITFHFSPTPHPMNVRRRIRLLRDYISLSSDWISYALIDDITDGFAPMIQSIEDEVNTIEDEILSMHTKWYENEDEEDNDSSGYSSDSSTYSSASNSSALSSASDTTVSSKKGWFRRKFGKNKKKSRYHRLSMSASEQQRHENYRQSYLDERNNRKARTENFAKESLLRAQDDARLGDDSDVSPVQVEADIENGDLDTRLLGSEGSNNSGRHDSSHHADGIYDHSKRNEAREEVKRKLDRLYRGSTVNTGILGNSNERGIIIGEDGRETIVPGGFGDEQQILVDHDEDDEDGEDYGEYGYGYDNRRNDAESRRSLLSKHSSKSSKRSIRSSSSRKSQRSSTSGSTTLTQSSWSSTASGRWKEKGDMLRRIGECRKRIMSVLRLLGSKADVIKGFSKRCNEQWEVAPRYEIGLYLGDIQDHIVTMVQSLNHYEKLLARSHSNYLAQLNIDMTRVNNEMNDVLSKITILGTIVLPMNIVTGLWGMNVIVPGQDVDSLTWFWSITGTLFLFGCLSFVIARKVYGIA